MVSPNKKRLLTESLDLSAEERAELACELIRSLDGPADFEARDEWSAEIQRRVDEVVSGSAVTIDREEFSRRVHDRLMRL